MSGTTLAAGTKVTYTINNNGKIKHEMVLEKDGVADEPLEFNGEAQEAEYIEPGTTRAVEWTNAGAGNYQLACHVEGHYEAGMKTAFIAEAAAPVAAPAAPAAAAPVAALLPLRRLLLPSAPVASFRTPQATTMVAERNRGTGAGGAARRYAAAPP